MMNLIKLLFDAFVLIGMYLVWYLITGDLISSVFLAGGSFILYGSIKKSAAINA